MTRRAFPDSHPEASGSITNSPGKRVNPLCEPQPANGGGNVGARGRRSSVRSPVSVDFRLRCPVPGYNTVWICVRVVSLEPLALAVRQSLHVGVRNLNCAAGTRHGLPIPG